MSADAGAEEAPAAAEAAPPPCVPPISFAMVENGVYRLGHPLPISYPFLAQLRLRTIIYLGDKTDMDGYYQWMEEQGIVFHHFPMHLVQEPFVMNDPAPLTAALQVMLDAGNYPMLIHSNKGKHRIGVLVGLMRRLFQGWALSGIFDEYDRFAGGKGHADMEFIEEFAPQVAMGPNPPLFVRVD